MQDRIRTEVVRDLVMLRSHAEAWDQLAMQAPQRLPMLSHAWVSAYLEHCLQADVHWACLFAYHGENLVGVMPIIPTSYTFFCWHVSVIETPFDKHTRSGDILTAQGYESPVIEKFLATLEESADYRSYFLLHLKGVRRGSPVLATWHALKSFTFLDSAESGSFLEISGSIDTFKAGISKNFAGNLRKSENKLAKLPQLSVEFITGESIAGAELQRFLLLEDSGWKGSKGTSVARCPRTARFYAAMTEHLREKGWLEWHFLSTEHQTIAGQLAVRFGRSLVILKIAYNEDYATCAPGNHLFLRTVERAFASGDIDEVNCLTDMPWHRNWRMKSCPYYDVEMYPHRLFSFIFGVAPKWSRSVVKRMPGLRPLVRGVRSWVSTSAKEARNHSAVLLTEGFLYRLFDSLIR